MTNTYSFKSNNFSTDVVINNEGAFALAMYDECPNENTEKELLAQVDKMMEDRQMKKYVIIDDGDRYEFTLNELAENITKEYAAKILTEDEFKEFCKIQEAKWEKDAKYVHQTYFPGCYGDALADC